MIHTLDEGLFDEFGEMRPEGGGRRRTKDGGRRTPEPRREPRPWQIPKKPKPFGLSKKDLDYLTANTHFDEKEIK